jgi:hypothetical protein
MRTPEAHEPARLQLAETWLDEQQERDADFVVAPAPEVAVAESKRPATVHCYHCGGDLTRSHVSRYERALTFFTRRRPYRCIDCRRRRWRAPLQSMVQS